VQWKTAPRTYIQEDSTHPILPTTTRKHQNIPECTGLWEVHAQIISKTEYLTVRRSQRLNPELHTKEVIDALNAETERQRLERQERLQQRRQKRLEKEDSSQSTEASDTESVTSTNPGKAHQEARDQFDTYLADLKLNLQRLEETPKSEKQNRIDVLHSILDNYDDLASIGDTFNDDRHAHFEPKFKQYQQQIDEADSPEARAAAEQNLSLWQKIFDKGLCVVGQAIHQEKKIPCPHRPVWVAWQAWEAQPARERCERRANGGFQP
jgi:hypothetical protein